MNIVQNVAEKIITNVGNVIIGKRNEIRMTVIGLLCEGHILIEDVPGVGKTMMARALSKSIGGMFNRIQFTPDMLPTDVTGVSVYNQKTMEFEFRAGPIMSQIVLADEINRATPKTQSALLEAMEEHQVTVDGHTYPLGPPFLVLATQNPIEYEGTFPLPEAQLDRFIMRIELGYPTPQEEIAMLDSQQYQHPVNLIQQVVSIQELVTAQQTVREVYLAPEIKRYIIELVSATRRHPDVYLGASPRGALALFRTAQGRSASVGRDYVQPDDIKALAESTLAHRIIVGPAARIRDVSAQTIIREILSTVPVPGATIGAKR
ncbi:AAA family ATPase [Chloroflexota bacterium]